MAFDDTRLNSWLNQTKLQTTNQPLWQILQQMVRNNRDMQVEIGILAAASGGGGAPPTPTPTDTGYSRIFMLMGS